MLPTASGNLLHSTKFRLTEDGLHLANSILWFDSFHTGELSFLSTASYPLKKIEHRVIANEETVKIFEAFKKKPKALVCQNNRPFSLGPLHLELLPSGSNLGSASLYIEYNRESILYAPNLQSNTIPTVRRMQLRKAKILILSADAPIQLHYKRKKEKEALLKEILLGTEQGVWPIIFFENPFLAAELTKGLSDLGIPVLVHDSIYKIQKIYEFYGFQLGNYGIFTHRPKNNKKVWFFPASLIRKLSSLTQVPSVDRSFYCIHDNFSLQNADSNSLIKHVVLRCKGGSEDFAEIITQVAPQEVYFLGAYARKCADEFRALAPKVKVLYENDQPTLLM